MGCGGGGGDVVVGVQVRVKRKAELKGKPSGRGPPKVCTLRALDKEHTLGRSASISHIFRDVTDQPFR